jgi:hypothetical protein
MEGVVEHILKVFAIFFRNFSIAYQLDLLARLSSQYGGRMITNFWFGVIPAVAWKVKMEEFHLNVAGKIGRNR